MTTLVAAVSGQLNPDANLIDTLNGSEFTVFAPVDSAFAKLDAATIESLKDPANADVLSSILTYHVVDGQIAPDQIVGMQTTVNGAIVDVTGSGDNIMVDNANVICGGVQTANATADRLGIAAPCKELGPVTEGGAARHPCDGGPLFV